VIVEVTGGMSMVEMDFWGRVGRRRKGERGRGDLFINPSLYAQINLSEAVEARRIARKDVGKRQKGAARSGRRNHVQISCLGRYSTAFGAETRVKDGHVTGVTR
jgi:hypothetical protein